MTELDIARTGHVLNRCSSPAFFLKQRTYTTPQCTFKLISAVSTLSDIFALMSEELRVRKLTVDK